MKCVIVKDLSSNPLKKLVLSFNCDYKSCSEICSRFKKLFSKASHECIDCIEPVFVTFKEPSAQIFRPIFRENKPKRKMCKNNEQPL